MVYKYVHKSLLLVNKDETYVYIQMSQYKSNVILLYGLHVWYNTLLYNRCDKNAIYTMVEATIHRWFGYKIPAADIPLLFGKYRE